MPQPLRTTLDNGLNVLLLEVHTAPVISHWVWYRVGSRDEPTGRTGVSHWVEHMQFKGTPKYPAGVLDKAISRQGGFWNAFTFLDWTAYFETLPAQAIDLALDLEADRMVNSLFDPEEVERERTVVISERQGNENSPQFRLGEEVQAAAFRVHPYHHEIIGDLADLERMTHEDLYRHYRTYYIPNNAVLAVAGDFQTEAMLRQIEAAFGAIPAGPEPPRLVRPEPPQRGERRVVVEGPGETAFLEVAYHAPKAADSDFFPFLVLDSLLTGPSNLNISGGGISNRTSRLYRRLVEGEIAASVSGGFQATLDPFLFSIAVTLRPDRRPEEALQTIDEEVRRLQDEPPPADEVARAVKQARALFAYGSESTTNLGFWLGFSSMVAQVDWFLTFLDRLAEVTPQEVQRMAQAYLRPQNRVVGTYLPTNHAVEVHHE